MKTLYGGMVGFVLLIICLHVSAGQTLPVEAVKQPLASETVLSGKAPNPNCSPKAPDASILHHDVKKENSNKVCIGATMAQVCALMGKANGHAQSGSRTTWLYEQGIITFKDGKVESFQLLSKEELAFQKMQERQLIEEACEKSLQQQEAARKTTAEQTMFARRKAVADQTYARRQAAAQLRYEKDLATAEERYNEQYQRAVAYSNSVTADSTYSRRTRMDAPKQLQAELATISNSYGIEKATAKNRYEASLREAEANYKTDMSNLEMVVPEQTIRVQYE